MMGVVSYPWPDPSTDGSGYDTRMGIYTGHSQGLPEQLKDSNFVINTLRLANEDKSEILSHKAPNALPLVSVLNFH